MRHVCRCFPPTVFATHLPTLSSISFCDVFADFILQQISLSNWNIGQCAPHEDSDLYNRDAVWTFKGSKRIIPSNQMKNFAFAICSASKGSHKVLLIQLHLCSLQKSSSLLPLSPSLSSLLPSFLSWRLLPSSSTAATIVISFLLLSLLNLSTAMMMARTRHPWQWQSRWRWRWWEDGDNGGSDRVAAAVISVSLQSSWNSELPPSLPPSLLPLPSISCLCRLLCHFGRHGRSQPRRWQRDDDGDGDGDRRQQRPIWRWWENGDKQFPNESLPYRSISIEKCKKKIAVLQSTQTYSNYLIDE